MSFDGQSVLPNDVENIRVALLPAWLRLIESDLNDERTRQALKLAVDDLQILSNSQKEKINKSIEEYIEANENTYHGDGYEGISDLGKLVGSRAALKAIVLGALVMAGNANMGASASTNDVAQIETDILVELAAAEDANELPGAPSMKEDLFLRVMDFTSLWEGGKVDDPVDRGGRTNMGVTQKTFDSWRDDKGLERLDVFEITATEAYEIYKANYWNTVRGDELPERVALAVFDFGVNCGTKRAIRSLQKAVGVTQDGIIGPQTITAVQKANPEDVFDAVNRERNNLYSRFIAANPEQSRFKNGWQNRVNALVAAVDGGGFESLFLDWRARLMESWSAGITMGRVSSDFV